MRSKYLIALTCIILFLTGCSNNVLNAIKKVLDNEDNEGKIKSKYTNEQINNTTHQLPIKANKSIEFNTFSINKRKYYGEVGYVELILKLPQLVGTYEGIAKINDYFIAKENVFYKELPTVDQEYFEEIGKSISGKESGYFRSATYQLEAVIGDIISVSAELDGGAGGVGWAGIEGESFDLNTGEQISMDELFKIKEDDYKSLIYNYVSEEIMNNINKFMQNGGGSGYHFDNAYSEEGYEAIHSYDFKNFYLTPNSLVVFYPKYVLTCGAAGPQEFEIPLEEISDVLAIDLNNTNVVSKNNSDSIIPLEFNKVDRTKNIVESLDEHRIVKVLKDKTINNIKIFTFIKENDEDNIYGGIEIKGDLFDLGIVSMILPDYNLGQISINNTSIFNNKDVYSIRAILGANCSQINYYLIEDDIPRKYISIDGNVDEIDLDNDGIIEIVSCSGTLPYTNIYEYNDDSISVADINATLQAQAVRLNINSKNQAFEAFYGKGKKIKLFKYTQYGLLEIRE